MRAADFTSRASCSSSGATPPASSAANWRLRSSGYAKLGKDLFVSLFALQMVLATLGAVSAASDLVTKEIRAGTLSILTCSPLTPFRIAFGKWKAAFAQGGILILCGAPVGAFCVYLGGPTAGDLTYSIVISFAATALGAATGLYFSTRFRSGVTALLVSSGALTLYAMLPALIRDYTERSALPDIVSPKTNLVDAARAAASRRPGTLEFEWSWISFRHRHGVYRLAAAAADGRTAGPAPPRDSRPDPAEPDLRVPGPLLRGHQP